VIAAYLAATAVSLIVMFAMLRRRVDALAVSPVWLAGWIAALMIGGCVAYAAFMPGTGL
jgi:hypothetical protein